MMESYLTSSVPLGGARVAVKDVADYFEAKMQLYSSRHLLLDIADHERLERLRIWDEQTESHLMLEQAAAALTGVLAVDFQDESKKLLYAQQVMKQYYERVLDGEALRNEMLEKQRAFSKAKMESLLGSD